MRVHSWSYLKVIIIKDEKIEHIVCTADSEGINFSVLKFQS